MSNSINCPSCNAENAFGSNFCNKCGTRLPPSSTVICSVCQTPNPSNRFYCDNCGTRLVPEDTPAGADPGEPDDGGETQVFSLPSRKPGDTGELDPRAVPDWLRTGKLGDDDEEDEEEVIPETGQRITGKLPRIEELTSERKGTGDLPDWLVSELDSEPIIQPSPITTEYYQDLLGEHDDEDLISPEAAAAAREAADLPGWLSEADQTAKLPPLEDEPEGPDNDLSGWLAELGREADVDLTEEEVDVPSSQTSEPASDELGWMSELRPPDTDLLAEPDAASEAEPGRSGLAEEPLPDWLTELGPPNTNILSRADDTQDFGPSERPHSSLPADDEEASPKEPDWLLDYSVMQTGALASQDETDDTDVGELDDEFPATDEGTSDWLPESESSEFQADADQDDESREPADAEEEEISEWLSKLTSDEPEELIPLEGEQLPDWLAEPSQSSFEAQSQIDSEIEEQVDELMQAADLQMTAWMSNISRDQPDDLVPTDDEDLPEWLRPATQTGPADAAEPEAKPKIEPSEIPEWLTEPGLVSDDTTTDAAAIDEAAEFQEESEEEISEWLSKLTSDEPDELIPADDAKLPDWLAEPTPSSFDSTSKIDSEIEDQVDELMQAADLQMTAWLSNIAGDEAEDDLVSMEGEALPDWLTEPSSAGLEALDEEKEVAGETDLIEDDVPSWLTETGVIEQQTDEATPLEKGELPDWLEPPAEITESPASNAAEEDLVGWMADLDSSEPDAAIVDEYADDLQLFEESAEEPAVAADEPAVGVEDTADLISSWFADLEEELDTSESDAGGQLIDDLFAADEMAEGSDLDWLTQPDTSELPDLAAEAELPIAMLDESPDETIEPEAEFEELPLTEEPDWLSELESQDSDILTISGPEATADEASEQPEPEPAMDIAAPAAEEPVAEIASEFEQMSEAATPEPEVQAEEYAEDDWLMDESLLEETGEGAEMPDWIGQLGAPLADQPVDSTASDELAGSEELPEWVASLRPTGDSDMSSLLPSALAGDGDFADMTEEMSEAALPDWLHADEETLTGQADQQDSAVIELPGVPAWLKGDERESSTGFFALQGDEADSTSSEWADVLGALPPAVPLAERLARAEIPDWVQELKPRESTEEEEELEPETIGPLSGMRGVVQVEPIISTTRVAQPLSQFTVTKEQQQQAALLRQLVTHAEERADAVTLREIRTPSAWVRIVLSAVLLAVIVFGLLWPDFLQSDPPPLTTEIEAVDSLLQAVAGQPVLVAIEYTPAMAGELTPQASMLLEQLAANGSPVITVSQFAAGTAVASGLAGASTVYDLGLIPGEAVGLRQLGSCLADDSNCSNIMGHQIENDLQQRLADVGLVIVLTGDRDSLVNWIEQVGAVHDIPLLVGITQSLAPVAAPYRAAGQLNGVIAGISDTIVFRREFQVGQASTVVTQQLLIAQNLARVSTVVLLIIGGLFYGMSGRSTSKSRTITSKS
jgi:hypothetical protein